MNVKMDLPAAVVGRKIRYVPHSLNHRIHWRARYMWTKAWKELVWQTTLQYRHLLKPLPLVMPTININFRVCRRMDRDNAYTAAKPILDGLKLAGLIIDDSEDHIELKVTTEKVFHKADQRTEIIIENA